MHALAEELRPFLGTWINTNEETTFIYCFSIQEEDGEYVIRTAHVHTEEIGETAVDVFAFKKGESAFQGRYSLEEQDVELAAFTNMGLIVVAAYVDEHHNPGLNYLAREFYVPLQEEDHD